MLLAAWSYVQPAHAQFSQVWATEALQVGQQANLFATWSGQVAIDGLYVDLPAGCTLLQAHWLRDGYEPVPADVQPVRGRSNRYKVTSAHPLQGLHELVLNIRGGENPATASWTLTPFTYSRRQHGGRSEVDTHDGLRFEHPIQLKPTEVAGDNQVLSFERPPERPLLLASKALPDLGQQAPHTVAFWINTTGLNEVVLSTWDGDEDTPYPLELVIDAGGRLLYYRGRPGEHQSMMTPRPIADGSWHHVAVMHNPRRGWTRLLMDGRPVDSLYTPVVADIAFETPVAVGGRLPAERTEPAPIRPYSGQLDELRLWSVAYPAATIRRTMNEPSQAAITAHGVALNFEQDLPRNLLVQPSPRLYRRPSDLIFYHPIHNLNIDLEEQGIMLSWQTEDRRTTAFIIERSTDGQQYTEIGRVDAAAQRSPFHFFDGNIVDEVLFYRIRQRFDNGTERTSGTLKMGMADEPARSATLVGNFPNPFNPTTTITYQLTEPQSVHVAVLDLAGQLIAVLVDETRAAGLYEVQFNAGDLPSGPYFIRLQTREGVQTRQMILTK